MRKNGYVSLKILLCILLVTLFSWIGFSKVKNIQDQSKVVLVKENLNFLRVSIDLYYSYYNEYPDLIENPEIFRRFCSLTNLPGTPCSKKLGSSLKFVRKRDNSGGWVYYKDQGKIFANIQNGAFTGNSISEVWMREPSSLLTKDSITRAPSVDLNSSYNTSNLEEESFNKFLDLIKNFVD